VPCATLEHPAAAPSPVGPGAREITILGGRGRTGEPEPVRRVDLRPGQVVTIVGATGSGKTTLINDIELFADQNTPTGRRILVDGRPASPEDREDPSRNPVALITQHTHFLSDLPVGEFLSIHALVRSGEPTRAEALVRQTVDFANRLTGEPIEPSTQMTELSGGQTRALLIADSAVICSTPVVLLDEVENAGIHRGRALEMLRRQGRIFVLVTHDPGLALMSDYRIVMAGGQMTHVHATSPEERALGQRLAGLDEDLSRVRERLRAGGRLGERDLEPFR
jgi:ABC-type lipoprotein export system ATPase subunit